MNEFDQFVKHELKIKHYVRYTDDFIVLGRTKENLLSILPYIDQFLQDKLRLSLHPKKVSIRALHQGIDFLGYVVLPHHRMLRTKTRRRIFKKVEQKVEECRSEKISQQTLDQSLQSYLGVLSHANTYKLSEKLKNQLWF